MELRRAPGATCAQVKERAGAKVENGLFSGSESGDQISVEGYKPQKRGDDSARFDEVGPDYFATVGTPSCWAAASRPAAGTPSAGT
jgi:hypothetical protein